MIKARIRIDNTISEIVLALFFTSILFPVVGQDRPEKIYMAIEFNSVVFGYS